MSLKSHIRQSLPTGLRMFLAFLVHPFIYSLPFRQKWFIRHIIPLYQRKALKKLKEKNKIRCVFLALFDNNWKYDRLYKLMKKNPRFEPIIVVCPVVNYGKQNMLRHMEDCYDYFEGKGYNPIRVYNKDTDTYLNLKDLKPDILFYTNPYKGLIDDRYFISRYTRILTAYVPYCFQEAGIPDKMDYNQILHNSLWRYYGATCYHEKFSKQLSFTKGRNVKIVGYPGIEELIDGHTPNDNCWKNTSHSYKRIIWAPHHTLTAAGPVNYSTFLKYCDFMLRLAEKYKDKTQWVFKPHPLLINKLYELWGKEKTDSYYAKWKDGINTNFVDGDYTDLFLTSDAMVHDCGSFLAEYLYTNKPVMRPLKEGTRLEDLYSEFGIASLDNYYMAHNEEDIENFVKMVIAGEDPMKEKRTKFVNEVLMPKHGMPSDNILNDIIDSIDNQRVFPN